MAAADNAGTLKLKMLVMENIDMFRHPKYYKELRKRNKSDQVISESSRDGESERAPGPGQQHQASSSKQQASSFKLKETQASSGKHQAPSTKRQA